MTGNRYGKYRIILEADYNHLECEGINTFVVNEQHIKGVPGRKTDVNDVEWICDLTRHGLVKASFIPDREQRELREITRYRQDTKKNERLKLTVSNLY